MIIDLERISRDDAIGTARAYISQWEDLFNREGRGYIDGLSLNELDYKRLLKVLLVGIGELSK